MALGSTNSPGIAGKDAAEAKRLAQAANENANAAKSGLDAINKKIANGEIGGGSGGNVIKITFEDAFVGQQYTVSDGDETKTGTVPDGLVVSVAVVNCNSTYTIKAQASNGVEYSTSVATGVYYGQYTASLAVFNATINVTAVAGAEVRAAKGSEVFTATAGSDGVAAVRVNQTGAYTITGTKDGASSNTASVNVSAQQTYTAAVQFIVLTVKSPSGSALTLTKGDKAFTKTTTGTDVFYLPSTGPWSATITKGSDTATGSINCSAYQAYTLELAYKPVASTSKTSGVNYANGIASLTPEQLSEIGEAISDNSAINNTTSTVYIDHGASHWKISTGDKIAINLNGDNYDFQIIGFNHDDLDDTAAYGKATATGKAGISLQMVDCLKSPYYINHPNTNSGGWKNSTMRTSTMATMKGYLSAAWKSAIKTVKKKASVGESRPSIETVSDDLFLLAEVEIFGSTTNAAVGEGEQYAYWKANDSASARVKKVNGSADYWWERSPDHNNDYGFCLVNENGYVASSSSGSSNGVTFGFCV